MSATQQITYAVNFGARNKDRTQNVDAATNVTVAGVPRVARLLALAIRLEGLVSQERVRDYSEVARRGRVTRARMTQIMQLCNLASDIQEQILFLPSGAKLNERNLRPLSNVLDWDEQRRQFHELLRRSAE